jgi:hypothetical protein
MLGVIIPYRDRQAHLDAFVPHLATYFQRDKLDKEIPYRALVIEQGNDKPFNRGMLLDIGATLAQDCDYLCFHDVDYLPLWADYSRPPGPARIIWYGCEVRWLSMNNDNYFREDYDVCFGGVILIPRPAFEAINGYPICYWGWGFEDCELRLRFQKAGIPLHFRDGTFWPLRHDHNGYDPQSGAPNEVARANEQRYQQRVARLEASPLAAWGGLNSLDYRVVQKRTVRPPDTDGRGHFEMVTVDFPISESGA